MADNSLNFSIKIKDEASATLKKVSVSIDGVGKMLKKVTEEANKAQNSIVDWSQAAQAADMLEQSVQQLFGVCKDLTNAYQAQLVAETQLQTVMKQRMSATDEEIQSIRELASAQQALGVIGDEVQLSGAQQMATFLNEKTSLDALIPAMNNLLAQQKGLNATNQDAVGIGNMMGKAMQGQVDVLQQVGMTFTDAQKSVLQYGTESERAAMLAQVIRDNVGEMNAELAKTDAGKQKQMENTLGNIKEQFGAIVQPAMNTLTVLSQFVTVVTGIVECCAAVKSLNQAFASVASVTQIARSSMLALNAIVTVVKAAFTGAAVGATTLKVAIRGLMISTGIGVAIAALTFAIEKLFGTSNSTSAAVDRLAGSERSLKQANDAYTSTVADTKAGMDLEISSLANLIKGHGDESGKVQELNQKYGDALGYHKSAAEWYDVLTRKSADYCKAIGYEAQAKVLASQKAEKEMQLEEVRKQKKALEDSGKTTEKTVVWKSADGAGSYRMEVDQPTAEYGKLTQEAITLEKEIDSLGNSFNTCMEKMQEGMSSLKAEGGATDVMAMGYDELGKEIESTESKLRNLAPTETAEIKRLSTYNKELKARKEALGNMLGLGDGGSKGGNGKEEIAISPGSLEALEQKVNELKERQRKAPIEEQLTFTPDIVALEVLIENINYRMKHAAFEARYTLKPTGEESATDAPIKRSMQSSLDLPQEKGGLKGLKLEPPKLDLKKPLEGMEAWNAAVEKAREKNAITIDSMSAMGSAMGSLGELIGGAAGAWLDWAGNLLNAIAQALPQLAALATANTATAATGAASSVASIPFVGPIMAVAAVASVLAALTSLPKFANGALAYGPTLGLFGEYAGASNNPEVVAPLDRLRQLIQPAGPGGMAGEVRFRIDGRSLAGVLERETKLIRRS